MKCSKCGYLGFETGDRCRNCGYEFSLSNTNDLPDLTIHPQGDPAQGRDDLDDYTLVDAGSAPRAANTRTTSTAELSQRTARGTPPPMPLFAPGVDDDAPLITKASPPRAPLAVRRSTPEVARLRAVASPKSSSSDLALDLELPREPAAPRVVPSERARIEPEPPVQYEDAGFARRIVAGIVDALVLFAIDAVVIYLTMQICGVGVDEFSLLPKGPLVAFLVVQNVGYLIAFTAGGQTLGKMAAGIKVVSDDVESPLDVGCALKRTALWLLLAFPAGLGLLPALFDRDHRGLHDRFAGTRVVRATA